MAEPPRRYAFALATFHVCVLVLAFVLVSYPGLAGVAGANTLVGLAAFALLWFASYRGTAWALAGVEVHRFDVALRRGIGGGARAGVIVVLGTMAVVALGAAFSNPLAALFVVAVYGVIGSLVAAVIGGAVGFLFGIADWLVLRFAGFEPQAAREDAGPPGA